MKARLLRCEDVASAVKRVLGDVVALQGAPYGDLQLHSPRDATLYLVAQTGLPRAFLDGFKRVHQGESTVCARALRAKKTVVVEDVETDWVFRPYVEKVRAARVRSVHSTPMLGPGDRVVGVVSTHFEKPYKPTPVESHVLHAYSAVAGDHLARLIGHHDERAVAESLQSSMWIAA